MYYHIIILHYYVTQHYSWTLIVCFAVERKIAQLKYRILLINQILYMWLPEKRKIKIRK